MMRFRKNRKKRKQEEIKEESEKEYKKGYAYKVMIFGEDTPDKIALVKNNENYKLINLEKFCGTVLAQHEMNFPKRKVTLGMWGVSNSEQTKRLIDGHCTGARACLLVYDPTSACSLNVFSEDLIGKLEKKGILDQTLLVGVSYKSSNPRQITPEQAQQFAEKIGCTYYGEVYSMEDNEKLFREISENLLKKYTPLVYDKFNMDQTPQEFLIT